ncbi:tyrosine-type recombinase/integrase [Pasteurella skyensis]|uniref:Tyrosine-type recombinase/integrase n=1 Tax=Phocoenobacter skyensis TaxID=97481 RepID=A0AAJ6N8Z0_9PAST|nr:site-specific integrase [Pasteurella skyensis]MDP8162426.1 tyrosine-type recombinase/integrase [Pasteurella skyensis]MDP8172391.1 tyrosine-type recombinase/integrase [Pasteurella skyensis]MDP8177416.1 tyrosine-type recombinase/integrase [Pasteurella skyensis]MDP8178646.1 tyrosine-type recombinase/integrase [Pasteurella skyensis]MDP8183064.1 tyrosine-type recombinase/integrase [Pasteurella skyensis]
MNNYEKKGLTSRSIQLMTPNDKYMTDIGEYLGLRVVCGKTGKKTFIYRYRSPISHKKNLIQIKLGVFPQMSLTDARKKLQDLKYIRSLGRCPATEYKQYKKTLAEKKKEESFSVRDMIDLYLQQYIDDHYSSNGTFIVGRRNFKGQKETRRTLYNDIVKPLGHRVASSLTRKEITAHIQEIVDKRGARVQAGRVLNELSLAYKFAISLNKFPESFINPAFAAKEALKMSTVKLTGNKATRAFNENELKLFMKWLPLSSFRPKIQNIFLLTLFTGCRTGEICAIAWDDVDFKKKTVFLRETKTGASRYVQLSSQAMMLLKSIEQSSKYVFQVRKKEKTMSQKYLTECTWNLRRRGLMINIEHWSPHDLRRTVRTGLARLGCPSDIGEAILGHSKKGIEGTYNLHTYDKECKKWLQTWGNYLTKLIR